MKKRIFAILFAVVLSLTMITTASAETTDIDDGANSTKTIGSIQGDRTLPLVVDNADLLNEDEEDKLNSKLEKLTETYKTEVAVVTVSDLDGKSPTAYADDFYDYNGYGYGSNDDGVLVLLNHDANGKNDLNITTHGSAIEAFSDSTIEDILYDMKDLIVDEKYYDAFNTYADMCEDALQPPSVSLIWIPVCLVVGFILAFIITKIVESSLRTVKKQYNAKNYVRKGSMVVTDHQDIFLYRNVTQTKIEKDDSSTHTSSSGRTHGGGGISF